ncbi:MAG: DUF5655 domain-containing protein [Bacilli bacterium]
MENDQYLFSNKNQEVKEFYDIIITFLNKIGPYQVELKKTSIHLSCNSAFLGVHPKKQWLDLNIVSTKVLKHPQLRKHEQVSKNRFHNEFRIKVSSDLNSDLLNFIKEAYLLKADNKKV